MWTTGRFQHYEIVPKVNNHRELQLLQTWLEICVCVCMQKEESHPSEGEGLRAAAEFAFPHLPIRQRYRRNPLPRVITAIIHLQRGLQVHISVHARMRGECKHGLFIYVEKCKSVRLGSQIKDRLCASTCVLDLLRRAEEMGQNSICSTPVCPSCGGGTWGHAHMHGPTCTLSRRAYRELIGADPLLRSSCR